MTTRSAPAKPARVAVVWIGPSGHTSPVFGALTPGQTYHTDDQDLARVLIEQNAAFWSAPAAPVEE